MQGDGFIREIQERRGEGLAVLYLLSKYVTNYVMLASYLVILWWN